ncbi:MAG: hypothetical protein PHP74_00685 [Candidatus Gracilibacteria bacterium]|nr:hypothetical protein [Candidatus Gracilibacteria bacterium]
MTIKKLEDQKLAQPPSSAEIQPPELPKRPFEGQDLNQKEDGTSMEINEFVVPGFIRDYINQAIRLTAPDCFMSSEQLHVDRNYTKVVLSEILRQKLAEAERVLTHESIDRLIEEGKITVALIKPNTQVGKLGKKDGEVADEIIRLANESGDLRVIFSVPVVMAETDFDYFYSDNYENQSRMDDPDSEVTIWDRVRGFMRGGAINEAFSAAEAMSDSLHSNEFSIKF